MITEEDVAKAYLKRLRLNVRRLDLEKKGINETNLQFEERLTADADFDILELQYLGEKS